MWPWCMFRPGVGHSTQFVKLVLLSHTCITHYQPRRITLTDQHLKLGYSLVIWDRGVKLRVTGDSSEAFGVIQSTQYFVFWRGSLTPSTCPSQHKRWLIPKALDLQVQPCAGIFHSGTSNIARTHTIAAAHIARYHCRFDGVLLGV